MLIGERIVLKLLHPLLFPSYLAMFSPTVQQALHTSRKAEKKYLHAAYDKASAQLTFFYCLIKQETQQLIGAVEIREYATGQLYCWLNEQYWGQGLLREALQLAADDYFVQTKKLFFTAHVDVGNKRSYCALKKCGFIDTGVQWGGYGKQYRLLKRAHHQ